MSDDSLSKEEKHSKVTEYKNEKHALIKELKKDVPGLKARYLAKKKAAKAQIKAERKQIKADQKEKFRELLLQLKQHRSELKKATSDFEKEQIKAQVKSDLEQIAQNREAFNRQLKVTKKEAFEKAISIMNEVGIDQPEKRFRQFPFQFSGGMRQRIVIAIALTANPELLICDEPTTALDVTIQGQILNLIKQIKEERDLSVIFITHDLGVVANMANRVAVMYAGKIVEYGESEDIFYRPQHPYTWALLSSVPDLDTTDKLLSIPGTPPDMLFPPKGDAFAARNKHALKIDFIEEPPFFKISDTHYAATWLLHPDAPKIEMPKIINERVNRYKKQAGIDAEKLSGNGKHKTNAGDQVE
ncbi:MAG: ABC transporter ATP-binding protein [Candidatus Izimaplasma sp.]|nr:ABC transporter ATP-binding protein [Candidatus Izimaplasma bacterium]